MKDMQMCVFIPPEKQTWGKNGFALGVSENRVGTEQHDAYRGVHRRL